MKRYGYFGSISTSDGKFRDGHHSCDHAGRERKSVRSDRELIHVSLAESYSCAGLPRQLAERTAGLHRLEAFRYQHSFRTSGRLFADIRKERCGTAARHLFRRKARYAAAEKLDRGYGVRDREGL